MHTFSAPLLPLLHVFAATYAGGFLSLDINECFERVSIGKRLNSSDVTKTIYNTNLKQCSNECERILCNAYSYGVNVNGIGTCLLSLDLPKLRPYDDPEFDLFVKILQCRLRTTCFNKLVGGRRLNDKHIQRTLPVESKGDCELFCEYEKEFRCEGFNFRYDVELNTYSSCQLTSVPSTKLDLSLDFQSDLDYDFFEKNVNASPSCRYLDLENPYGLGHQWGVKPDLTSLWQGFNPSLYQKNDVGYGNEKAYYDGGVLSTAAAVVPEYDGVNLLIRPNNDLFGGLDSTLSTADRLLVSTDECFIKARTGHHLQRENIIKSMNAPSLFGCETVCANEQTFTCNIFSYRYTFTSSMDNCHMGDKMIRQLDIFRDLVPDRDCDVFVRNELSQPGCQPARNWDTDCFERIRSGLTFQVSVVKFSVQTDSLHECELICLHVKHFTCRLFSFRRATPVAGKRPEDNCYLTDYPVVEMDPVRHFVQDADCDVYNRGSYGRGCELDKLWPGRPVVPGWEDQTPTVHTTYRPQYGVPPPPDVSYPSDYRPKYGPPSQSPTLQFFPVVPPSQPPQFLPAVPPSQPPQFLPAVPSPQPPQFLPAVPSPQPPQFFPAVPPFQRPPVVAFDTSTKSTGSYAPSQPPTTFFHVPVEYTPVSIKPAGGVFDDLFDPYGPTRKPTIYGATNKPCYVNFGRAARLLPSAVRKAINVRSEHQCKAECDRARDGQRFRCSTLSYFGGYCELSDVEMRDLRPNQHFGLDQRFRLYAWDFDERDCFGGPPAAKSPAAGSSVPGGLERTWMRFTVNGQPCRSGSYCTQNADVGVWSCPVDHGEWDYCCRPDHKCGYSEGIDYPWCHVGKSTEQWRPCSDKYFPSTDGSPQTWPVTYIHHTGPPAAPPTGGSPAPSDGPPFLANGTQPVTIHEQSLVDQFLSIFSLPSLLPPPPPPPSSSTTASPSSSSSSSTASPSSSSTASPSSSSSSSSAAASPSSSNGRLVSPPDDGYRRHPVPGFRVVDVTTRLHSHGNTDRHDGRPTKGKPYVYV